MRPKKTRAQRVQSSTYGWKKETWRDGRDYKNELYNILNERTWQDGHEFYLAVIHRFFTQKLLAGTKWAKANREWIEKMVK